MSLRMVRLAPVALLGVGLAGCPKTQESQTTTSPVVLPSASEAVTASASTSVSASATATASASASVPRGTCPPAPPGTVDPSLPKGACKVDADCKDALNGRCGAIYAGRGRMVVGCTYDQCTSDADCTKTNPNALCYCNANFNGRNGCINGNCKDDSDCTGGAKCDRDANGSYLGWFCRTPRDTCKAGASCKQGEACSYSPTNKRWDCAHVFVLPPG